MASALKEKPAIIEWSGPSSSGKTQLAHSTMIQTAMKLSGKDCIYFIDSGTAFAPTRLREMMSLGYTDEVLKVYRIPNPCIELVKCTIEMMMD